MPSFADIQAEIANIMDSVEDMTPEQLDACADYIDMLATQEAEKDTCLKTMCMYSYQSRPNMQFLP